jgi:hypothetical protein
MSAVWGAARQVAHSKWLASRPIEPGLLSCLLRGRRPLDASARAGELLTISWTIASFGKEIPDAATLRRSEDV